MTTPPDTRHHGPSPDGSVWRKTLLMAEQEEPGPFECGDALVLKKFGRWTVIGSAANKGTRKALYARVAMGWSDADVITRPIRITKFNKHRYESARK